MTLIAARFDFDGEAAKAAERVAADGGRSSGASSLLQPLLYGSQPDGLEQGLPGGCAQQQQQQPADAVVVGAPAPAPRGKQKGLG